jgi:molecular chaperone GrpE
LTGPGTGSVSDQVEGTGSVSDRVEAVLADFRRWLETAAAVDNGAAPAGIDLHTVLAQSTALRQEVHLQTRAVRAQQEQNAELLRHLEHAVELLSQPREDTVRPLLGTLVELYDALALAARENERTRRTVLPLLDELAAPDADDEPVPEPPAGPAAPARSFWSRWVLSPSADAALRASQEETERAFERLREERLRRQQRSARLRDGCRQARQLLEGLLTGYTMGLQRLERALAQQDLEPIPTVGERFDPEQMEVLEAVAGTGRPAGEVVEEVRRGYLWKGRVFRFSLVRVARDG